MGRNTPDTGHELTCPSQAADLPALAYMGLLELLALSSLMFANKFLRSNAGVQPRLGKQKVQLANASPTSLLASAPRPVCLRHQLSVASSKALLPASAFSWPLKDLGRKQNLQARCTFQPGID